MNQNRLRKERQKSTTPDWQSSFIEMWEKVWNSTTQDLNDRLKCFVTPRAGKWNKQTPQLTFLKIWHQNNCLYLIVYLLLLNRCYSCHKGHPFQYKCCSKLTQQSQSFLGCSFFVQPFSTQFSNELSTCQMLVPLQSTTLFKIRPFYSCMNKV